MATHSSTLAWRIPWTEEPDRLQSMGSQRVRHNRVTNTFTFMILINAQRAVEWTNVIELIPLSFLFQVEMGAQEEAATGARSAFSGALPEPCVR